jgi:hypothetical protein
MALLPTSVRKPRAASLRSIYPSLVSEPHLGGRQVQEFCLHAWAVDLEWPPLVRAHADELFAFLVALRGQVTPFTVVLPDKATARGQGTTAVTTGPHVVSGSGRSVLTDGWDVSESNVLLPGDLVKFAGHTKVYMITAAASSNSSGEATLTIEPALVAAVAEDEVVVVDQVPLTIALTSDVSEITVNQLIHYGLSVSAKEVW